MGVIDLLKSFNIFLISIQQMKQATLLKLIDICLDSWNLHHFIIFFFQINPEKETRSVRASFVSKTSTSLISWLYLSIVWLKICYFEGHVNLKCKTSLMMVLNNASICSNDLSIYTIHYGAISFH